MNIKPLNVVLHDILFLLLNLLLLLLC